MTFAVSENCCLSEDMECALTFASIEVVLAIDSYKRIDASKYYEQIFRFKVSWCLEIGKTNLSE